MIDLRIEQVTGDFAEQICRDISANLPEYFGLPEVNEHYAQGVRSRIAFAAIVNQQYVGLISGKYIIENIANTESLPIQGGYIMGLPLPIVNGTEAPLRLIALLPKEKTYE